MKRPWEINIGRVLLLFLYGVICMGVSLVIQSRSLNPVERASLIKRACVRAQLLSASFANLFQSCREIEPGSIQQSSCGPSYFPPWHYCNQNGAFPNCRVQYNVIAINPDQSVECSCQITCSGPFFFSQLPKNLQKAKP